VVLRYRKVVARYPRSGYSDNALLAAGTLYREMAQRFRAPRYREDAVAAYRTLVAEYPSSSLGDQALWAAVEIARESGERRRVGEAARAYLDAYPEGKKAAQVKALLRQREPQRPLPSAPPPGLARVFDLRSWSGDSSTRVVIDLEREVRIQSDRARDPDRLWIDLIGTRLHPNLARRVFPVGDGLLAQVRVAQNRPDVVRVVLDFKDVAEHQLFYLESPARLVVDVRGTTGAPPRPAGAPPTAVVEAPAAEPPVPPAGLPTRSVEGLVPPGTVPPGPAGREPIAITGVDRLPSARRPPPPSRGGPPPPPPPVATAEAAPARSREAPPPSRRRRTARAATASPGSSASARGGS
jgi:hypothetical protein